MAEPLPCCNLIEHPNGTATRCNGLMALDPSGLQYLCNDCRARCGSLAHPTC